MVEEWEGEGDGEDYSQEILWSGARKEIAQIESELFRILDRNKYYGDPISREDIERLHGDLVRLEARMRTP